MSTAATRRAAIAILATTAAAWRRACAQPAPRLAQRTDPLPTTAEHIVTRHGRPPVHLTERA